jgi:hypothetical protein
MAEVISTYIPPSFYEVSIQLNETLMANRMKNTSKSCLNPFEYLFILLPPPTSS